MAISIAWLLDKLGNKLYSWSTTKAVMDFDRGGSSGQTLSKTLNDGLIQEYTCVTSGTTHALTGTGNNIKFVADVPFNEGDTITVNGSLVSAYTQDGEALTGGAWATGMTVVCYLDGSTLNFKGGGGSVTVEGLSADVVLAGKNVTVNQGTKELVSVTGNLVAPSFAVGAGVYASNTRDSGYGGFYINENNQFVSFASYRGSQVTGNCKVRKGQTLYWTNIGNCLTMNFGETRTGTGSYTYQEDTIVAFTLSGGGGIGPDTATAYVL